LDIPIQEPESQTKKESEQDFGGFMIGKKKFEISQERIDKA